MLCEFSPHRPAAIGVHASLFLIRTDRRKEFAQFVKLELPWFEEVFVWRGMFSSKDEKPKSKNKIKEILIILSCLILKV